MPRKLVFETQTLIDIAAFTTFGLNVKVTNNAIGVFGTGLKYSVAVLCREKIPIHVWAGRTWYSFEPATVNFRNTEFTGIVMYRVNKFMKNRTVLAYTTELGKFWALWQVFRELYSNTLDENGSVRVEEADYIPEVDAAPGKTLIVIESDEMVECYYNRAQYFLEDGANLRTATEAVQVLDRPNDAIFYRGIRVASLPRKSLYTYNVLASCELTEDRTLKYLSAATDLIVNRIVRSTDKEFIRKCVTAPKDSFEGGLTYQYGYMPSTEFRDVMKELHPLPADRVSSGARTLFMEYFPPPPRIDNAETYRDMLIRLATRDDLAELYQLISVTKPRFLDLLRSAPNEPSKPVGSNASPPEKAAGAGSEEDRYRDDSPL